jgi:hypothetical protein
VVALEEKMITTPLLRFVGMLTQNQVKCNSYLFTVQRNAAFYTG